MTSRFWPRREPWAFGHLYDHLQNQSISLWRGWDDHNHNHNHNQNHHHDDDDDDDGDGSTLRMVRALGMLILLRSQQPGIFIWKCHIIGSWFYNGLQPQSSRFRPNVPPSAGGSFRIGKILIKITHNSASGEFWCLRSYQSGYFNSFQHWIVANILN